MDSTEVKCLFCRYNADVSGRAGLQQHLQAVHRIQLNMELAMTVLLLSEEERTNLVAGARNQINFDLNPGESSVKSLPKDENRSDPVLKEIKIKRKSLSILESKAPVAGKVKFFKNLIGIEPAIDENKMDLFGRSRTPKSKQKNKRESLVDSLLKKTLTEHLQGQKSADDTINTFDEIFAAAVDLDDSVEGPFNKLLEEDFEVKNEQENEKEVSIEENGADAETDTSSDSAFKEGTEDGPEDVLTKMKVSPSRACRESLVFNTPTNQNGVYVCYECKKTFRFLTYLKSHRNSKYGCSGSGGKSASSGKKPPCPSASSGENVWRPDSGQKASPRLSSM